MLRQFLSPPNWFTAANLFCGFYAVHLLMRPGSDYRVIVLAGWLVLFGAVFDMLDGRVARMTHSDSAFGTQLDSLSDIVTFGLAPALLAWKWCLHQAGLFGLVVAFLFVVCGAFRLARFNCRAQVKPPSESCGITITMAGITVALLVASFATAERDPRHPWNTAVIIGALSLLMVSRVPYRTFKTLRLSPVVLACLALLLGILVVFGTRFQNFAAVLLLPCALYVTSGPAESLVRLGLRRLKFAGRAPDSGEDLFDDTDPQSDEF
ncbi:MAG: CDP-diacylglycerol--serine O-phosphatidyltransferase [Deltaproteobacteria bacterium]|nr:CDP-diacylglycerol--serine O-phosphatidyltransferase [Deltaproteobacteria bacterium]